MNQCKIILNFFFHLPVVLASLVSSANFVNILALPSLGPLLKFWTDLTCLKGGNLVKPPSCGNKHVSALFWYLAIRLLALGQLPRTDEKQVKQFGKQSWAPKFPWGQPSVSVGGNFSGISAKSAASIPPRPSPDVPSGRAGLGGASAASRTAIGWERRPSGGGRGLAPGPRAGGRACAVQAQAAPCGGSGGAAPVPPRRRWRCTKWRRSPRPTKVKIPRQAPCPRPLGPRLGIARCLRLCRAAGSVRRGSSGGGRAGRACV